MSRRGFYRKEAGVSRNGDSSVGRDVDPDALGFIQKYLTSYTKWEVLKYLAENPSAAETSKGFARRLGKDIRQISEALKSLARTGIVRNGDDTDGGTYRLSADDAQRTTLQRIVDMARTNNRFRLLLNYHITKASLEKYKSRGY